MPGLKAPPRGMGAAHGSTGKGTRAWGRGPGRELSAGPVCASFTETESAQGPRVASCPEKAKVWLLPNLTVTGRAESPFQGYAPVWTRPRRPRAQADPLLRALRGAWGPQPTTDAGALLPELYLLFPEAPGWGEAEASRGSGSQGSLRQRQLRVRQRPHGGASAEAHVGEGLSHQPGGGSRRRQLVSQALSRSQQRLSAAAPPQHPTPSSWAVTLTLRCPPTWLLSGREHGTPGLAGRSDSGSGRAAQATQARGQHRVHTTGSGRPNGLFWLECARGPLSNAAG